MRLLDRAKQVYPNNYDILKFITHLLMTKPRRFRYALDNIEKLMAMNPKDPDVHLMKGILLETTDSAKALHHLEQYAALSPEDDASAEINNNMGCLCILMSKFDDASRLFDRAAAQLKDAQTMEEQAMQITVEFNRARLLERKADPEYKKASFIYQKILEGKLKFPWHFDRHSKDLIKKLLTADLTKRIGNLKGGVDDIKKHKWFTGLDWQGILSMQVSPPIKPSVRSDHDTSNFEKYPDSFEEGAPIDKRDQELFVDF